MSSTRLLVLGVVRFAQPVHGYDVRRELLSWRLGDWVNLQPGSIYSSLKTLERDGLIAVTAHAQADGRPERTEYVLTVEGEKEFQSLLRTAWWHVDRGPEPLFPALCFLSEMPRGELISALHARVGELEGEISEMRFVRASIRDGAVGADGEIPEHVRESIDFMTSRTKGDIAWTKQFIKRLRAGEYTLAGEERP